MRDAVAGEAIQRAMQVDRARASSASRRFPHWAPLPRRCRYSAAGWPSAAQICQGERRDRGLAAGTGDGCDHSRLARIQPCRRSGQGTAGIADLHESDAGRQRVRGSFGHHRGRPVGERRRDESGRFRPWFPARATNTSPGRTSAAVGGQTADVQIGEAGIEPGFIGEQIAKFHRSDAIHRRTSGAASRVPALAGAGKDQLFGQRQVQARHARPEAVRSG